MPHQLRDGNQILRWFRGSGEGLSSEDSIEPEYREVNSEGMLTSLQTLDDAVEGDALRTLVSTPAQTSTLIIPSGTWISSANLTVARNSGLSPISMVLPAMEGSQLRFNVLSSAGVSYGRLKNRDGTDFFLTYSNTTAGVYHYADLLPLARLLCTDIQIQLITVSSTGAPTNQTANREIRFLY